jgi:UDP-N-acetylglucosamine 4,6-dehydratase
MNLLDLARAVAPECDIARIGIRPGEKLHEVLVSEDEARNTLDMQEYFLIQPASAWWPLPEHDGEPVPAGFSFTSDKNERWLTGAELGQLIDAGTA